MKSKVSIIGAGMTGSTAAHWLAELEIAENVAGAILKPSLVEKRTARSIRK